MLNLSPVCELFERRLVHEERREKKKKGQAKRSVRAGVARTLCCHTAIGSTIQPTPKKANGRSCRSKISSICFFTSSSGNQQEQRWRYRKSSKKIASIRLVLPKPWRCARLTLVSKKGIYYQSPRKILQQCEYHDAAHMSNTSFLPSRSGRMPCHCSKGFFPLKSQNG